MSTNSTIFIGTWTNWSRGQVYGATLTLHTTNAAILIAALTMWVGLTGAKSWSILCFVFHQYGVTRRSRDGAYHQLQATLRNNGSHFQTVWEVLKIAWAWSICLSPRSRSFRRILGLLTLGFLHALLFGAAGLLASHLTSLDNEVLVRSPNCGQWSSDFIANSSDPTRALFDYATHLSINADLSAQYFQDCLSGSQSSAEIGSSTECNVYKTLQLPYNITNNVPCLFPKEMCLGAINSSVKFDTGLIDSTIHLGINAPKKERVQLRKTMTCSPITTKGFVQNGSVTLIDGHITNFSAALYGPEASPNTIIGVDSELVANSTVLIEKQNGDILPSHGVQYYTFNSATAFPNDTNQGFIPIPSLALQDQTLTLMFVTYVGYYLSPSNDLWMPAHQPTNAPSRTPDGTLMNLTVYTLDNDVNVLACTEQLQICNPNRGLDQVQCTPMLPLNVLESWYVNTNNSGFLQNVLENQQQMTTASQLMYALDWAHLHPLLGNFGGPPLLLNSLQEQLASLGLAEDQWLQESNHLFSLTLNTIQRFITEFATGPPSPYSHYTADWVAKNPSFEYLCNSQIIRSPNFTSFSILGIALIFGLGGLVICISMYLESVVGHFQQKYRTGLFQQVRWQLDGTLQLQRMAFEEAGLGQWMGGAQQVPTTVRNGQKIMMPQNWDEEHPSLMWSIEKARSARSRSTNAVTLVNEAGEFGEDSKMLLKERNRIIE